jgi:hypothetical protein
MKSFDISTNFKIAHSRIHSILRLFSKMFHKSLLSGLKVIFWVLTVIKMVQLLIDTFRNFFYFTRIIVIFLKLCQHILLCVAL